MTPYSTRLIHLLSSIFIVAAMLTAVFITLAHAETNEITQITQDLPKCAAISDQLFGQDSLLKTHGMEIETKYSFCDSQGKNCSPTYVIGARG